MAPQSRGGPLSPLPAHQAREPGRWNTEARKDPAMSCTIRPLDASTWDAFAELVERNNGIFGGCWCMGYHPERGQKGISRHAVKEDRVRTGRAHAALVLDEDGTAQGWCQGLYRRQSATGPQISSATSMTRSGPGWPGSLGARTSPVQTQTTSFSRR